MKLYIGDRSEGVIDKNRFMFMFLYIIGLLIKLFSPEVGDIITYKTAPEDFTELGAIDFNYLNANIFTMLFKASDDTPIKYDKDAMQYITISYYYHKWD